MNSDIKIQLCRDDFYLMMRNAVVQAGGTDNLAKWKTMKLEELVYLFAQNGIRMTYMPEKHMNSIKIIWEDPSLKKNKDLIVAADDGKLPRKKQLLFDSAPTEDDSDP